MPSFADSGDFIYSGVLPFLTDVMVKFWVMVNICWFIAKSSIVELTLRLGNTILGFFLTLVKIGAIGSWSNKVADTGASVNKHFS